MPSTSPPGPRPAKGKGLGGSRRARTAAPSPDVDGDGAGGGEPQTASRGRRDPRHPRGTAKDRALLLLGVRWRSREELRRRLTAAGFEPDQIEAALTDLQRAGLIDDARFAREVVREQAGRRLLGDRAIRRALREKGVDAGQVEDSLELAGAEEERADQLAERQARRMVRLAPETAYRRLVGLLVRRGYGSATAREAARRALALAEADAEAAGENDAPDGEGV